MWRELAFMLDQLDSNCPKLGTTEFPNLPSTARIWVEYDIGANHFVSAQKVVDVVQLTVGPRSAPALTFDPATIVDTYVKGGLLWSVPKEGGSGFEWYAQITAVAPNPNLDLNHIQVGFVQHIQRQVWSAHYSPSGTTLVASLQGDAFILDTTKQTFPFYKSARLPNNTVFANTWAFSPQTTTMIIGSQDTPTPLVPMIFTDRGPPPVFGPHSPRFASQVDRQSIRWHFVLDVVALTDTDAANGAPNILWKQATTTWTVNTTGSISFPLFRSPRLTLTGPPVTSSGQWIAVGTPTREDTSGPIANDQLPTLRFTPQPS
jgi:hypothetical protein